MSDDILYVNDVHGESSDKAKKLVDVLWNDDYACWEATRTIGEITHSLYLNARNEGEAMQEAIYFFGVTREQIDYVY